ncbi:hypothetical protein EVAR_92802_1 [Eumeta japonica]|uniref:Uncharacterized protein n=1 Tax=Eumeta variegata TaxID=151549 RepID=A0A4C1ZYG8_EUMVA|nr:hypothetical protein EVAR_92802_1 [Eumeta japonica]
MKDTSEGFFNTAVNCPSALLCSAAFYEAPPPRHFFRGPLNVVTDRQGVLIADLERLNERDDVLSSSRNSFTQLCYALNGLCINFFLENAPIKKNPGDLNLVNGLATR